MKPFSIIPLSLCLMLVGCTSYRYEISADNDPVREISKKTDLVVAAAPAQLRLKQVESRCVLMIENPGKDSLSLQSSGSAIVDPDGQTRAIAARLIPPGSYMKLILPPIREIEPRGPVFGIGVGMHVDASSDPDAPQKAIYLNEGTESQEFWEWDGAGSIKLFLALKQGDQETQHQFVISRQKE